MLTVHNPQAARPKAKPRQQAKARTTALIRSIENRKQLQKRPATAPKPTRNRLGLKDYLNCLRDPWFSPPVRLGWGCYVPTSIRSAFFRTTWTIDSIRPFDTVVSSPRQWVAAGSSVSNGFFKHVQTATATQALQSGDNFSNAATNSAYLSSTIQSSRVIAAALRITVHYAATDVPGNLFGLFLPEESMSNIDAQSASSIIGLFAARRAVNTTAGETMIEVQYRPFDPLSFSFRGDGSTTSIQTSAPQMLVGISGYQPGSVVTAELVVHHETNGGLDGSSDDTTDSATTLSAAGVTMDMAGSAAAASQPVATNGWAIEALDSALSRIAGRNNVFSGRFGGSRNGWITPLPPGESSISSSSPATPATSPASASGAALVSRAAASRITLTGCHDQCDGKHLLAPDIEDCHFVHLAKP